KREADRERGKKATFAKAIASTRKHDRHLPQAIGHRGYKAAYPENSMAAVRGAVEVGAHAVEIDIHLSADGVVVLSHDPTLKRCFGVDKKVADCDWEYLSTLETLREPREPMARLRDVLSWLCKPGLEDIWVVLDVKPDDDPNDLLAATKETLDSVTETSKPWDQRVLVACWNTDPPHHTKARTIQAAHEFLPTHPASLVGFHLGFARHFLPIPGLGMSVLHRALGGGAQGTRFLEDVHAAQRPMLTWTVNDESWMEWCVRRSASDDGDARTPPSPDDLATRLFDGVITDDPRVFLQVCSRWEDELDGRQTVARRQTTALGALWEDIRSTAQSLVLTVVGSFFLFVYTRAGRFDYFSDAKKLKL
ncbi:phosphatidylglycerol phospholipase C, partial [Geosmithia morbida]